MEIRYGPRGPHTELEARPGEPAERRRVHRFVRVRDDGASDRRH